MASAASIGAAAVVLFGEDSVAVADRGSRSPVYLESNSADLISERPNPNPVHSEPLVGNMALGAISQFFQKLGSALETHVSGFHGADLSESPFTQSEILQADHLAMMNPAMDDSFATEGPRPLDESTEGREEQPPANVGVNADKMYNIVRDQFMALPIEKAIPLMRQIRTLNELAKKSGELNASEYLTIEAYDQICQKVLVHSLVGALVDMTERSPSHRKLLAELNDPAKKDQQIFDMMQNRVQGELQIQHNEDLIADPADLRQPLDNANARRARLSKLVQEFHILFADDKPDAIIKAIRTYQANASHTINSPSATEEAKNVKRFMNSLSAEVNPYATSFKYAQLPVVDQGALTQALDVHTASVEPYSADAAVRSIFNKAWKSLPTQMVLPRLREVIATVGYALENKETAGSARHSVRMWPDELPAKAHQSVLLTLKSLEAHHVATPVKTATPFVPVVR